MTGNRELARIYSQITASIREEYRLMAQMLRLEGDAYQSAENRLQVVREQVDAYREMIQQTSEAGQTRRRVWYSSASKSGKPIWRRNRLLNPIGTLLMDPPSGWTTCSALKN